MRNDVSPMEGGAEAPVIEMISLQLLRRSEANPRKHFDPEKLKQLSESIRARGVIQPIVVRPAWCVGWAGGALPGDFYDECGRDESFYEIVAGERRYRASLLAERTEAPCVVLAMSDREARELRLIENLQREDLSALEEAEAVQELLEMRDESGAAVHTVPTIARAVNLSPRHLWRRLKLLLLPEFAKELLRSGEMSATLGELIGRVPDVEQRERAANEIVYGTLQSPGMMSVAVATKHLAEHYQKSTKGAAFDPADETLLPEAGACPTCAFYGANVAPGEHAALRADMCTNTACFARKEAESMARWKRQHGGEGRRVLSPEENALQVHGDHFVFFKSEVVGLDDVPEPQMRTGDVGGKTWRELIGDRGVEVIVGRSRKGKPIEGVRIAEAAAAAALNGHPVRNPLERGSSAEKKETLRHRVSAKEMNFAVLKRLVPAVRDAAKAEMDRWLARALAPVVDVEMDGLTKLLDLSREEVLEELRCEVPSRLCALAAVTLLLHYTDHENAIGEIGRALLAEMGVDEASIRAGVLAERDRRVLIDVGTDVFYAALKVGGKVTSRKSYVTEDGLVKFVEAAETEDVVIDAGFRPREIADLAERHGWRAIRGAAHAKELAEIEEATEPLHPRASVKKSPPKPKPAKAAKPVVKKAAGKSKPAARVVAKRKGAKK